MEGSCGNSGGRGALFSGRASSHWRTWVWYLVEDQSIRGVGLRGRNAMVVTWPRLLDSKPPAKHAVPFSVPWVVPKVLFFSSWERCRGLRRGRFIEIQLFLHLNLLITSSPVCVPYIHEKTWFFCLWPWQLAIVWWDSEDQSSSL